MANTFAENSVFVEKTRDLCQALLASDEFKNIQKQVSRFFEDEPTMAQYQFLSEQSHALNEKRQQGDEIGEEEMAQYQSAHQTFINNPIGKGFLEAQEQIHQVESSVRQYVIKTFELGRIPEAADFPSDECGSGCGCH